MRETKFKHYPVRPKRLTAAFAKKEYQKILDKLPIAEKSSNPDLWLKLFADWNALGSYLGSEGGRINHAYNKNMADEQLEEEVDYFRDKIIPAITEPAHQMTALFLNSQHKKAVLKEYGEQLGPVFETALKPFDPINTRLRIEASKIAKNYEKKISAAVITIQGEKMTLWKSRDFMKSPDEPVRKEAYLANRGWFLDNHDELAAIYESLVKLRTQMSKNVGYVSYVPLGYEDMGRIDYSQKEVRQFRSNVHKYVTPLMVELSKDLAKRLGKSKLRPWDMYDPDLSLPLGIVPVNKQLDNAQKLFNELSPLFGEHFKYMRDNDLIDLENRSNKRSGAYCISFSDEGAVAILCNSTGSDDDIQTLTHEMGHAFQGWESNYIDATDLQWGTAELAEIFSLGMEFLSLPKINYFFKHSHAEKFKKARWNRAIGLMCYVCVVDEFQHWVYQNPEATHGERDEKWVALNKHYFGDNTDFTGYEDYRKTRWYGQGHIFSSPFYYIDYALAETVAMQFALLDLKNHQKTMKTYLSLSKMGGTKSFLRALDSAGLQSPFDEKLMKNLTAQAKKVLL